MYGILARLLVFRIVRNLVIHHSICSIDDATWTHTTETLSLKVFVDAFGGIFIRYWVEKLGIVSLTYLLKTLVSKITLYPACALLLWIPCCNPLRI